MGVDANGADILNSFQMGHDAVVCVQMYEPWIVEAYNTSTGSTTLGIVGKGDGSTPSGKIRGTQMANTRYLNATGKDIAFYRAHNKSVTRMEEANDDLTNALDFSAPSPIVSPVLPLRTIFLLILTDSTGRFFHQWHWARWIHRALSGPVRRYPRTGRSGKRSTIPRRIGIHRRTIVRG